MGCWQCGSMPAGISRPGARVSGQPRGWHRGLGQAGEEWGRASVIRLAHRSSSPPSASRPETQVSAPAAFHRGACSLTYNSHVSRPPAFSPPGYLYADRPSMQPRPHIIHPLRVHHLHIFPPVSLRGGPFFRSPPVPAYLWRTSFRPAALQLWEADSVAVLPPRFPFSAFCRFDYDLQYFCLCIILYQAMHIRCFFVPIWCGIRVLTWARRQRVLCAAGTKLLAYCGWRESRPMKSRVDVKRWACDHRIVHKQG
ncbi:hypothetical protein DFH09DRAFT_370406 [Mycena vulgaris]|nr:hypothetical protein DFH09DRAFT_370406 [Mycena vulgaris]